MTTKEKLLEVHGDKDCHICGLPRKEMGSPFCSYPHGRLPVDRIPGTNMAIWKLPEQIVEANPQEPGEVA